MSTVTLTEGATAKDALAPGAVLGLVVSVMAMAALPFAVTGTNLALPLIRDDFGSSLSSLSWTLSGYSIVLAAFTLLGGTISSKLGSRATFQVGVALFTVASVVCVAAPNTPVLIAGRVLQGLGGALVVPSSVSVALLGWPESRRTFAIGIWTAAFPIGSASAPTISAALIDVGSWRWIFVVPMGLSALALVCSLGLPKRVAGTQTVLAPWPDVLGMVMGTAAAGLLALGIVEGRPWGWTSPSTIGVLAVAVLLIPVFVVRSQRHPRPFLPVPLFRVPTFRVANIANVSVSMVGMSVWLLWPLVFGPLWGYSQLGVGLAMTPTPCLAGLGAVVSGRLAARFGYRPLLIIGATSITCANLWFMLFTQAEADYWGHMFPGLIMMGSGMGLLFSPLNAAALIDLDRSDFASGNATFSTGRFLSGAIGIAAVVATLGEGDDANPIAPFRRAYGFLLVMSIIALIAVAIMWPRRAAGDGEVVELH